ncbi:lipid A deacylase LpxR family protein [Daejeonella oryzae]|uniref:lipid A deacylase LpxR family protein n=1 Tax=Daejeonella oryzae TaxID=1122943 RepID=UPI0003F6AAC2|nr:lipid A deacylase LpxR family protein [Daejeonella oryzae]
MKNSLLVILTFVLSLLTEYAIGQSSTYKSEFGFRSDNDAYLAYGQDRYYTNGLFITFRHATDQRKLNKTVNKLIWEAEAGQKMYNPQSGYIPDVKFVDRPFAAYLYAGGSLNWHYNSENALKVSLQAGTIGPSALGQDAQTLLHDIAGFYTIEGWETQVKDEFGLNAKIQFDKFLHRSKSNTVDFSVNTFANIGNTFSGIGTGILFRAGIINPFYNSAISNSRLSNNSASKVAEEKESFFYAKPVLQYVAYDATTEGGLFTDDKGPITFDVKPLVFSQQLGYMFSKNRFTADFSLIFKSREIKSEAKAHQYGSIALYYKFNSED